MASLLTQAQQGAQTPPTQPQPAQSVMHEPAPEAPEMDVPQDESLYDWEDEATPEEQQAFEAAVEEAARIIYADDTGHEGLLKVIANDPSPEEGYVKAVTTVVTELDKKMNLPVGIISGLAIDVFNMIDDIATNSGIVQLDDQQAQLAMAGVQDALNKAYGMEEEELEGIAQNLSDKDVQQLKALYEGATNGQGFAA
jgi:hypothetical protein